MPSRRRSPARSALGDAAGLDPTELRERLEANGLTDVDGARPVGDLDAVEQVGAAIGTRDGAEPLRLVDLRGARDDALASAAALRAGYLARLAAHLGELEATCERAGVHLHRVVTDEPLADALLSLLARLAGTPVARADAP